MGREGCILLKITITFTVDSSSENCLGVRKHTEIKSKTRILHSIKEPANSDRSMNYYRFDLPAHDFLRCTNLLRFLFLHSTLVCNQFVYFHG